MISLKLFNVKNTIYLWVFNCCPPRAGGGPKNKDTFVGKIWLFFDNFFRIQKIYQNFLIFLSNFFNFFTIFQFFRTQKKFPKFIIFLSSFYNFLTIFCNFFRIEKFFQNLLFVCQVFCNLKIIQSQCCSLRSQNRI